MYIKMLDDKSLIVTVPSSVYQHEANAAEIVFLVPQDYEGIALAGCTVRADFWDALDSSGSVLLTAETEMYEAYLQYRMPISQRFTGVPGRLRMSLVFLNAEQGVVLKTGEAVILVGEKKDVVDDMPDGTLDTLSAMELRLADIEASVSMSWSEI